MCQTPVLFFLLLASSSAFAADLATIQKSGTIRPATEGAFAPFNYFKGKELGGFEVDIVNLLAKKLQLKTDWKVFPFDSLLIGLGQDRYDLVAASHGVTDERSKAVDFTNPHYCTGGAILTREGGPLNAEALKGKTIAVQVGTTYLEHAKKLSGIKDVKTYPKDTDSIQSLMAGRVDAVVTDKFIAIEAAKTHAKAKLVVGDLLFSERVAIAVAKKNATLKDALNRVLAEALKDGSYAQISKAHFGQDIRCK